MNKKGLLLFCLITTYVYAMEETAVPKQAEELPSEEKDLITQASQAYQSIFGHTADNNKLTSIANKQQFTQATANTIAAVVTELGFEELFSNVDEIERKQIPTTDPDHIKNYKEILAHHGIARHIKEKAPGDTARLKQQANSARTLKNRYWLAGGAFLTCSLYFAYLYGKNYTWPNELSVKALTNTIGGLISNATKDKHAIVSIGGFITTLLCGAAGTKKHLQEQQFITDCRSYTQRITAFQDKIQGLTYQSTETTIKEILQKININLLVGQYTATKPITLDAKDILERTKSFCDDANQEEIILKTNTLELPIEIHITKLPCNSYCYTIDEPMSQSHIQHPSTSKEELLDIIYTTQSFALRNQRPEQKKEPSGSTGKEEGAQTSPPVIKRTIKEEKSEKLTTTPIPEREDSEEKKQAKEAFEKKTNEAAEEIKKMQEDDSTTTSPTTTEDQPVSPRTQRKAQEISTAMAQEQDQPLPKEALEILLGEYIDSPHPEEISKKQQADIGDNEDSPDTSAREEDSNSSEADKSEEEGEEGEKQIEQDVNSTQNPQSTTAVLLGAPITTRNRSSSLPLIGGTVGSDESSPETSECEEEKPQEPETPTSAENSIPSTRAVITPEASSLQLEKQKPAEQEKPTVVNPAINTAAVVLDKLAEDLQKNLNSNTTDKEQ